MKVLLLVLLFGLVYSQEVQQEVQPEYDTEVEETEAKETEVQQEHPGKFYNRVDFSGRRLERLENALKKVKASIVGLRKKASTLRGHARHQVFEKIEKLSQFASYFRIQIAYVLSKQIAFNKRFLAKAKSEEVREKLFNSLIAKRDKLNEIFLDAERVNEFRLKRAEFRVKFLETRVKISKVESIKEKLEDKLEEEVEKETRLKAVLANLAERQLRNLKAKIQELRENRKEVNQQMTQDIKELREKFTRKLRFVRAAGQRRIQRLVKIIAAVQAKVQTKTGEEKTKLQQVLRNLRLKAAVARVRLIKTLNRMTKHFERKLAEAKEERKEVREEITKEIQEVKAEIQKLNNTNF